MLKRKERVATVAEIQCFLQEHRSELLDGKTNHELATDLGFSVSTIRHETMAIFRAVGVSDRTEAAKAAATNGAHKVTDQSLLIAY